MKLKKNLTEVQFTLLHVGDGLVLHRLASNLRCVRRKYININTSSVQVIRTSTMCENMLQIYLLT